MIFTIDCTKYFFSEDEKSKYEKIGFTFIEYNNPLSDKDDYRYKKDDKRPKINFETLEELKDWVKENNLPSIIIDFSDPYNEIEIYDDYRE